MNDLPLHDIHLPTAVSLWPPAIGWWLLPVIAIVLGLIIYKFIQFKKQHKSPAYKKMALREIQKLENDFKNSESSTELLRGISALLRRIALSYLPRQSVASLTGEQWIEQLNQLVGETLFTPEITALLINAPYRSKATFNQPEVLDICKLWIQKLPDKPQKPHMYKNTSTPGVNA